MKKKKKGANISPNWTTFFAVSHIGGWVISCAQTYWIVKKIEQVRKGS
jgi:hypothetical protein